MKNLFHFTLLNVIWFIINLINTIAITIYRQFKFQIHTFERQLQVKYLKSFIET